MAFSILDQQLKTRRFLLGDTLTVLDIAWVVYVNRLVLAGYPIPRLHSNLGEWAGRLMDDPAFRDELTPVGPFAAMIQARQKALATGGRDLVSVCGLN